MNSDLLGEALTLLTKKEEKDYMHTAVLHNSFVQLEPLSYPLVVKKCSVVRVIASG